MNSMYEIGSGLKEGMIIFCMFGDEFESSDDQQPIPGKVSRSNVTRAIRKNYGLEAGKA